MVAVPLTSMVVGVTARLIVGWLSANSVAVLLTTPAPVSVAEIAPGVLLYVPAAAAVTLIVIVHPALAAIPAPLKLIVPLPPLAVTVPCVGQLSVTFGVAAT